MGTRTMASSTAPTAIQPLQSAASTIVTAQPSTNTYKTYNGHDENQESGKRGVITTIV